MGTINYGPPRMYAVLLKSLREDLKCRHCICLNRLIRNRILTIYVGLNEIKIKISHLTQTEQLK